MSPSPDDVFVHIFQRIGQRSQSRQPVCSQSSPEESCKDIDILLQQLMTVRIHSTDSKSSIRVCLRNRRTSNIGGFPFAAANGGGYLYFQKTSHPYRRKLRMFSDSALEGLAFLSGCSWNMKVATSDTSNAMHPQEGVPPLKWSFQNVSK